MGDAARIGPEALDALFARAEKDAARAGCAVQVAVARDGALAGFRTFGRTRHGDGSEREADDETLFSIFSVTKSIVSSAAWILLQEQKLALCDRVVDHIPEFGTHGKDVVRVEQLLIHTAGFPRAQLPRADWPDPERRLRHFANWRLEWEPGSRFVYHGTSSMWVLAELITRTAGVDYRDFIRARIVEPLGLRNLFLGLPPEEDVRVADVIPVGKAATEDERAASPVDAPVIADDMLAYHNHPQNRAIGSPGGGVIATAADVALFYQGMLADAEGRGAGIWQPEMLREAWTARRSELIDPMTRKPAHGRRRTDLLGRPGVGTLLRLLHQRRPAQPGAPGSDRLPALEPGGRLRAARHRPGVAPAFAAAVMRAPARALRGRVRGFPARPAACRASRAAGSAPASAPARRRRRPQSPHAASAPARSRR